MFSKMFKGSNNCRILNICCRSLSWSWRWPYDVFPCQTLIFSSEGSERGTNMQSGNRKGSLWCWSPWAAPAWTRSQFGVKSWQKAPSAGSELHRETRMHREKTTKKIKIILGYSDYPFVRWKESQNYHAQTWKRMSANGCREWTWRINPVEMKAINLC